MGISNSGPDECLRKWIVITHSMSWGMEASTSIQWYRKSYRQGCGYNYRYRYGYTDHIGKSLCVFNPLLSSSPLSSTKDGTPRWLCTKFYPFTKNQVFLRVWGRVSPGGSDNKEPAWDEGELGSIPGLGRCPGESHGYPFQYSCLENSMDRGAWWATIHSVSESQTQPSN